MGDDAAPIDSDLLAITLSDSEPDQDAVTTESVDRTALSEPAFQALKSTYRPKVQNGEVCFSLPQRFV